MKFIVVLLVATASLPAFAQRNIVSFSSITASCALDDRVFFSAPHDKYGTELFVSDGTTGNFEMVKDVNPGPNNSSPTQLTIFDNSIFFIAYTNEFGASLWRTDGTPSGTRLVYGIEHADPANLFVFKGRLYFTTNFGAIMRTDGTVAGTETFYQSPFTWGRIMTVIHTADHILFTSDGRTIYRDDGSTRISFLAPLSWEDVYFRNLFVVGDTLIVIKTSSYDSVIRIYALSESDLYDGRDEEWPLIRKIDAPLYGSHELESFTVAGSKLFFTLRADYDNVPDTDQLWISDGTEEGTNMLKSFSWDRHYYQSGMRWFFAFNNKVFFRGGNTMGKGLWTSDGTEAGTVKVHNVTMAPHAEDKQPVLVHDGKFYFSGEGSGSAELWRSDGTSTNTGKMLEFDQPGSTPHLFTISGDVLYFVTSQQFSSTLWSTMPSPDLTVKDQWGSAIRSGNTPYLFNGVTVGACQTRDLVLSNIGMGDLYLRDVVMVGKDYYIVKRDLPAKLGPGESVTLQLVFNPVQPGRSSATITILSNDTDESHYTVRLEAEATVAANTAICQFARDEYVTRLLPAQNSRNILLSNSTIFERRPPGTVIGELALPGNPVATVFTLSAGEGDSDNSSFTIENNLLKSNTAFYFDIRSLYTIRVKAVTAETETEEFFSINILNEGFGFSEGNCRQVFERIDFSYNTIEANSAGHLFASTSDGRIIRSTNEGINWSVVYSGLRAMQEIRFFGNIGYAYGENTLLKSEDAGASWFSLHLPFREFYINTVGVFFLSATNGFISSDQGEVFFTADGGRSWEARHPESWNSYTRLFFTSENNGFATDSWGGFFRTSDAGRTWASIDLSALGWGNRVRAFWFISSTEGFMTTDNARFYETSDSGMTWTEVTQVYGNDLSKIKFVDETVGFIYGGNGIMYKTVNKGKTWDQHFPQVSPARISGVAKLGGKIFITTASSYYASYQAARGMAVSSDLGATWSVLNSFSDGSLYYVDFTRTKKGIVTGEHGLFGTIDNGLTWSPVTMNLTGIADVHFLDENNVIILSERDLYKSTDGGKTIRKVLTTEQGERYLPAGKLYGFPGNILFSVSWYAVYRSDDEGETWQLVSLDPAYYTQDLHFISPTIGFRVELFGSVERTTDGGKTWQRIYTRDPASSDVFGSIYFVDDMTGYSGGDYLAKTTDGGFTWEKIDWPFYEIIAIYFENEDHGFVVSRGGSVYETNNGGQTFETIFAHSTRVFDVQFIDNQIFMVGEHGFAARLNTTPEAPPVPGYISGPDRICAGEAAEYFLSLNGFHQTHWSTTAENLNDDSDHASILFARPGEFTISASHFNACGTSTERTLTVQVTEAELPVIEGPALVDAGEQGVVYSVSNATEDASFFWEVQGSSSMSTSDNLAVIDWSENADDGLLAVLAVDASGCRANASFPVEMEVTLAIAEGLRNYVSIYPNPAEAEARVASSYSGSLVVRLLDLVGREYSQATLSPGEDRPLITRRLPAGVYIVEISDGKRTDTKKLIRK